MNKNLKNNIYCMGVVLFMTTVTTLITLLFSKLGLGKENLLMLFLIGILLVTVATRGYIYGFLAAILSVFLFNYLYTVPLHTFIISNKQDVLLMFFFLLASLICGLMSSKLKEQREIADKNAKLTGQLYEMTENFLKLTGVENVIHTTLKYLYTNTGRPCQIKLSKQIIDDFSIDFHLQEIYQYPENIDSAAEFVEYSPITGINQSMGSVWFQGNEPFSKDANKIVLAIIYQTALVLDREYIYMERENIKLAMEKEHLKSTLLKSISHDIRTPLAGIQGAASVLSNIIAKPVMNEIEKADSQHLINNIVEETSWLVMTIQNVLNMTRINEGRLDVTASFESVDDLFDQIERHIPLSFDRSRLTIETPKDIYLVKVDGNLFIQVLINLIDNSFKHAGDKAHIWLRAFVNENKIFFQVEDNGVGIDPSIKDHLFDSFTTCPTHEADKGRGIGLGLAICKTIVEACGGKIYVLENEHTVFQIEMAYENGGMMEQ